MESQERSQGIEVAKSKAFDSCCIYIVVLLSSLSHKWRRQRNLIVYLIWFDDKQEIYQIYLLKMDDFQSINQ